MMSGNIKLLRLIRYLLCVSLLSGCAFAESKLSKAIAKNDFTPLYVEESESRLLKGKKYPTPKLIEISTKKLQLLKPKFKDSKFLESDDLFYLVKYFSYIEYDKRILNDLKEAINRIDAEKLKVRNETILCISFLLAKSYKEENKANEFIKFFNKMSSDQIYCYGKSLVLFMAKNPLTNNNDSITSQLSKDFNASKEGRKWLNAVLLAKLGKFGSLLAIEDQLKGKKLSENDYVYNQIKNQEALLMIADFTVPEN